MYKKFPKTIMYWHENQFEYPNKKAHYIGFKELHNFISSDINIFNSEFHKQDFYKKANKEINKFGLDSLTSVLDEKYDLSLVVYPGFDIENINTIKINKEITKRSTKYSPIILWNHRWSKDKDYFMFFSMMRHLKKNKYNFKLNIFGEAVIINNDDFINFKKQMGNYINKFGFLDSKNQYYEEILKSDIVISTAIEENFGISMVESMYLGLTPVLPNRLSYPELTPKEFHKKVLYNSYDEAISNIKNILDNKTYLNLSEYMKIYDIRKSVYKFDKIIESIIDIASFH